MELTEAFIAHTLAMIKERPMEQPIPLKPNSSLYKPTIAAIKKIVSHNLDRAWGFEIEFSSAPRPEKHPDETAPHFIQRYAAWFNTTWEIGGNYWPAAFRKIHYQKPVAIDETINYLCRITEEKQDQNMSNTIASSTDKPVVISIPNDEILRANYTAFVQKRDALIGDIQSVKEIKDPATAEFMKGKMIALNTLEKEIDAKRKEIKAPFLDAGNRIDAIAKEIAGGGKEQVDIAKKMLFQWDEEQRKAFEETQRKAAEERQQAEESARAQAQVIASGKGLLVETEKSIFDAIVNSTTVVEAVTIRDKHIKKEVFYADPEKWAAFPAEAEAMRLRLARVGKAKAELLNAEAKMLAGQAQQSNVDLFRAEYEKVKATVQQETLLAYQALTVQVEEKVDTVVLHAEVQKATISSEVSAAAPQSMVSYRSTLKFEVVDMKSVPDGFKKVDEDKIKAFIEKSKEALSAEIAKTNGAGYTVEGIRFYIEKSPVMPRS